MSSHRLTSVIIFLITCISSLLCSAPTEPKFPVVLVPGDGGSQLYAKLDRKEVSHFYCEHKSDTFNIWVNMEEFLYPTIKCFADNMRLRYNQTTHTTHNAEGVDIHTKDFGDTSTIEWLDPSYFSHKVSSSMSYFHDLVETLVAAGYTRNKNIKGAPFDFRRAPNEFGEFFDNLTKLIEKTYAENNNSRVVIIGHSMGNPTMLYFYNHQPWWWKAKYIRAHISLAGVWAGAVKTLRLMTSGDNLGVIITSSLRMRAVQRSMPSTAFLMPNTKYWRSDEALVMTEHRNYTVNDYKQLFEDLKYPEGYMLWQDTQGLIKDLKAPNVEMHLIYGYGLDTPGKLKFEAGGFPDTYPTTIPDDGDGTVNVRSLRAFRHWSKEQSLPVKHVAIPKAEHFSMMRDERVLKAVMNIISGM